MCKCTFVCAEVRWQPYVIPKGLSSLPSLFCAWDRAFHWPGTHWVGYTGWLVSYRALSLPPLGKVTTMLSISQMGYGDWTQVLVPVLPLGDLWSTLRTHTHIYLTNILTVCAYVCGTRVYEDVIIPIACICEEEEIASLHWLFSALFHMESLIESGACQFLARLVARKPHNWCWDYRATLPQQGLSMVAGKLDSHPVLMQPSCSYPETGFQQPSITNARYREMTLGDQMYHSQSRQWLLTTEKEAELRGSSEDMRRSPQWPSPSLLQGKEQSMTHERQAVRKSFCFWRMGAIYPFIVLWETHLYLERRKSWENGVSISLGTSGWGMARGTRSWEGPSGPGIQYVINYSARKTPCGPLTAGHRECSVTSVMLS